MKRCLECGEPPHYHSWCTLCAQLFRVKQEPEKPTASQAQLTRWMARRENIEPQLRTAIAEHLTQKQAAERIGCAQVTISRWRRVFCLPAFARKPYGGRFHALDS